MEETITITLSKEKLDRLEVLDLDQPTRKKLEKFRIKTEIAELEERLARLKEDLKGVK